MAHYVLQRGYRHNFLNYDSFLSLNLVLILAHSADTDEMQHDAAFHLCLHCLPKYPLWCFQHTKCFTGPQAQVNI